MVLAMALSGTIGLLVVVESDLPVLWVVWLRCLLGGLGLAAWVGWSGQWSRLSWRSAAGCCWRGSAHRQLAVPVPCL